MSYTKSCLIIIHSLLVRRKYHRSHNNYVDDDDDGDEYKYLTENIFQICSLPVTCHKIYIVLPMWLSAGYEFDNFDSIGIDTPKR